MGAIAIEEDSPALSPYSMFKFSVRSEVTRKYYERRLRKFLDFVQFKPEVTDIEIRCNDFAERGKQNPNEILQIPKYSERIVDVSFPDHIFLLENTRYVISRNYQMKFLAVREKSNRLLPLPTADLCLILASLSHTVFFVTV
jgi:hypothetical protein